MALQIYAVLIVPFFVVWLGLSLATALSKANRKTGRRPAALLSALTALLLFAHVFGPAYLLPAEDVDLQGLIKDVLLIVVLICQCLAVYFGWKAGSGPGQGRRVSRGGDVDGTTSGGSGARSRRSIACSHDLSP